jgi:hypothetical protein
MRNSLHRSRALRCASTSPRLRELLFALVLLASAGARAQAPGEAAVPPEEQRAIDDERARGHYLAGESHFAAERWSDAAREFTLAYELSHRPEMLINLSRSHEREGELAAAVRDLELLLSSYPETNYRLEAEQRVAIMKAKLEAPPPVAPVAPVAPVVVVEAPAPIPAAAPVGAKPWPPRWPTIAVGSVAVAAGVAALATGLRAHSIYKDLDDRCAGSICTGGFESDRDRGRALSRASTGLMFVSIALAGTTAALWVLDVKRDQRSLAVGVNGMGAQLRARF